MNNDATTTSTMVGDHAWSFPGRPLQAGGQRRLPTQIAVVDLERNNNAAPTPVDVLRPGEGAGRPRTPTRAEDLSEDDQLLIFQAEKEEVDRERRRIEKLLESDQERFRVPRWIRRPTVIATVFATTLVLCLFVMIQVSIAISFLAMLSPWLAFLGMTFVSLTAALTLFVAGRFFVIFLGLSPNRAVNIAGLKELSRRTRLRFLVAEKNLSSVQQLRSYLEAHPLINSARFNAFSSTWSDLEQVRIHAIQRMVRENLLDHSSFAHTERWLCDFRDGFQSELDRVATDRITRHAKRVGVLTAASPNALIDLLIATHGGFCMLTEICEIYNLRTSGLGTAFLLGHVFFNAYVAGELNQNESLIDSGVQTVLDQSGLHLGSVVVDTAFAKVAGKLSSKTATGVLNFLLVRRLGKQTMRLLQPVDVV